MTITCFCRYHSAMARPKKSAEDGRKLFLQIRLTADEKQLFADAAKLLGLDVSAWVRSELLPVARRVIRSQKPDNSSR